jgi:deoxycytidylate deaminase
MGERLLDSFQTYGWSPDDSLSEDENFMDLVLLVTRSSQLKQGSMACILVRAKPEIDSDDPAMDRIISVANNQELYKCNSSDVHAEISAIGDAARSGRSTDQCTAYITMPPCKTCFGALLAAGVKRIVNFYPPPKFCLPLMDKHNIEMIGVADIQEHRLRTSGIVSSYEQEEQGIFQNANECVTNGGSVPANLTNEHLLVGLGCAMNNHVSEEVE